MRYVALLLAGASLFSLSGWDKAWAQSNKSALSSFEQTRKESETGDARAEALLGGLYLIGEDAPQDFALGKKWLDKTVAQGFAQAEFLLGLMYELGQGVQKDSSKAVEWYKKAAAQGDLSAQQALASLGIGTGKEEDGSGDKNVAVFLQKGAEQGDSGAQYNPGTLYTHGKGVKQDFVQAARWYRKSALQGDSDAQYNLGLAYTTGLGVQQDYSEAAQWYRKAAEQGNADAQANLAVLFCNGLGLTQDYGQARKWYEAAVKQNQPMAQYGLAMMYLEGRNVKQNKAKFLGLLQKAAGQGYEPAQLVLAEIILRRDNSQSKEMAPENIKRVEILKEAARQGDTQSQFWLAVLYEGGKGVERSDEQARNWLKKSCENHFHAACRFFERKYHEQVPIPSSQR